MVACLFDGDCRSPVFVLVQQRQTNGDGGIHIGMEQRRLKFTYKHTTPMDQVMVEQWLTYKHKTPMSTYKHGMEWW